jgi:isoleucyl-tRNA synthetase
MAGFKHWGGSADWERLYRTMDADYIAGQLKIFARLYEMGTVYQPFKPVYWLVNFW